MADGIFENIGTVVVFIFIAWWIKYNAIDVPRSEKQERERKIKEKQIKEAEEKRLIQEEIDVVQRATNILPNTNEAIRVLTQKYAWNHIIEVIGVFSNHLELLSDIEYSSGDPINLPNMQSSQLNKEERDVIENIYDKQAPMQYGDEQLDEANMYQFYDEVGFYGFDAYSNTPTVDHLRDLVNLGLVETDGSFSNEIREYTCSLTNSGRLLLKMDTLYRTRKIQSFQVPSLEVRDHLRGFVYKMLN